MGHYASEMDPEWGNSIQRGAKIRRIRDMLADIPLGRFTAKELPLVIGLFHAYRMTDHDFFNSPPRMEELDRMINRFLADETNE